PVPKLLLNMGTPMILSMVLQAVYNIIDSAFVSNMKDTGADAANALTLVFPAQMLMVAFGIGTGVGMNALVSKCLGQKNSEKAGKTAGNAFFLAGVLFILFVMFGIFGVKPYVMSQASAETSALTLEMAVSYLRICCICSFGIVLFSIAEKLLQAVGNSLYSTIAQIAGAVVNIILDPIMIYGWFGCPELGVKGAATATVIGQIVSAGLGIFFHFRINKQIPNAVGYLKPDWQIIREIYQIGLPAIIAQALMSFMTYGLNIIFVKISVPMQTAYGMYYKIQQFVLFMAFGLRDAITPVIAFSHGAGNRNRIRDGIKFGLIDTAVLMVAGTLIAEFSAGAFADLFSMNGETAKLFISAMHLISLSFLFAGMNIAFQGIYQALDGGIESLVISLLRQLIIIFPFILLFAHIAKQNPSRTWLVWTAFLIAELGTAIVGAVLLKKIYQKKVSNLDNHILPEPVQA
ncbi:MAG: MATE family efflux transporter, partial [Oscillospiraceae bacterium]|nr:MATE family efflux transporter [Oscillospiraceae bacterium]